MKIKNVGYNMTEIEINGCILLYSYSTPVAGKNTDGWCVDNSMFKTDEFVSVTTSRHINKWFREVWGVDAKTEVQEIPQEEINQIAEVWHG